MLSLQVPTNRTDNNANNSLKHYQIFPLIRTRTQSNGSSVDTNRGALRMTIHSTAQKNRKEIDSMMPMNSLERRD